MDSAAEWLEKNTGYCAPMAARITPEQCKINRRTEFRCGKCEGLEMSKRGTCKECKRTDMIIVAGGLCGKCYNLKKKNDLGGGTAMPRELPQDSITESVNDSHLKAALPPEPPQSTNVESSPLLAPQGFISKLPVAVPDSRPGLFVDFTGHESLLQSLQAECEDLGADIVWLLEQLDQGKLQRIA